MPETDAALISRAECAANINGLKIDLINVKEDVAYNKAINDKLSKILIGNGESGLVEKVNILMLRNTWIEKGFWLAVTIITNLFTLYLTGVLHL